MAKLRLRSPAAWLFACLVPVSLAAHETSSPHNPLRPLVVNVSARADVPAVVLARAQQELLIIFERIGVSVEWIGCGIDRRSDRASTVAAPLVVSLAVVSHESRAFHVIADEIVGTVVRTDQARETAWVMLDRIERAADRHALDAGLVLGHAMAHEVGHLLLPRGAHGPRGLMRAAWRMEDLRDAVQGQLGFSRSEAAMIRARLSSGK
jgi:hypothetical protein